MFMRGRFGPSETVRRQKPEFSTLPRRSTRVIVYRDSQSGVILVCAPGAAWALSAGQEKGVNHDPLRRQGTRGCVPHKNTIQVAEDIPESRYDFVPAPGVRSFRRMLTHVAIATRIWEEVHKKGHTTLVGFDFFGLMDRFQAEEAKNRSKAEILALLASEGQQFAAWLDTLTPEFLAEKVTEPDGKTAKTRFERFLGAKGHEMHHRAQLMLIERQLGIVPHLTRQFEERIAQMKAAKA
jgi:uncharacterized damage-inducible protein DinB